jgi:hypothetical protein
MTAKKTPPTQKTRRSTPDKVVKMTGRPAAIIDCFGILTDTQIRRYFELGCEVKGLGRGHVKRIKDGLGKGREGCDEFNKFGRV